MGWDEAVRVAMVLAADPGSAVGAALGGLEHPLSREGFLLADIFGVYGKAHFKNPKPHPLRPSQRRASLRVIRPDGEVLDGSFGQGAGRSKVALLAAFRDAGVGRSEPLLDLPAQALAESDVHSPASAD